MKIKGRLSDSVKFKILISIPLIIILLFLWSMYNPVGNLSAELQEPHSDILETFMDDAIPFAELFLIPYLLWFLFPFASLTLAFSRRFTAIEISSMYLTHVLLILSCFAIYLIFPTTSEGVMINLGTYEFVNSSIRGVIYMIYTVGIPYNAFPSYHVAPLVFLSIFLFYKWKSVFWASLPLTILVSAATVFIKFHYFVDILGGIVMGFFAYYILYKKVALRIMASILKSRTKHH